MIQVISPDEIIVSTQNNEFFIHLSKRKRAYGFSKYGNYICSLSFRNSINQELFKIVTNERELLAAIEYISEFAANIGCIISDLIHFENSADFHNYYWYIYYRFDDLCPDQDQIDSFLEGEQELYIGISVFEEYKGQKVLRCNFELTYEYLLDDFLFAFLQLLGDINYLEEISIGELISVNFPYEVPYNLE